MTRGTMEVVLVSAGGLRRADGLLNNVDPYVVIQYKNQQHKSHIAKGHGKRPVWNERFEFAVEYTDQEDEQNYNLVLQIMDFDPLPEDDYLGQTKIYLKDLFDSGMEKGEAELDPQEYRVVLKDLTYSGEIEVGIIFNAKV